MMMKKLLLSMMLLLAWTGAARANEVTIGDGTIASFYELPFNMKSKYSLTQQLYLAEELGGSGYIKSISFHYAYSSPFTKNGVQVYLKEVDESSTYSNVFPISASDKVFEGTFSASGAGWVTITFDTPFEYSGTKNLLVSCYDPTGGNSYSDSFTFYCTSTNNYKIAWYESDDQCFDLNNLSSYTKSLIKYRCNTKFDITYGPITKSLTVCDGTVTNTCVPVYGYYTDWYQKSEFIIPANKLFQLEDNTISKMTFYLSSPASGSWGSAKFKVFLKEVDATTISNYYGTTGATTVYEGPLDGTKSTMDIEFTTPYLYHGGNLLVGVYQTTKGTDNSATFIGSTASNASIFGMNDSNLDNVSINYENFIPKTTFAYYYETSSTCPKPRNLTVTDIDFWDATVSWTSDAAQWDLRYKSTYDSNWIRVEGLTSPTYSFNELLPYSGTKYEVQVRSNCGGAVSDWVSTSFVTTICDEDNRGAISYELTDSYGDGWNGNAINVVHSETGLVVATLDMTKDDGKMKKGTIDLCFGEDYDFVWLKGSFSEECSFTIKDNFGEDIIACQKCDALQPGLITTFGVSRYQWSGKRPTNLAIAEGPGPDRVTLTWTPGSENQTTWDFSYSKEGDMSEPSVENVHTTSPRYVFTGLDRYPLEPNTTYRVKVRSNASNDGGMSDWSNIITFTTSGENPIPSQVNVETTFVQATINWVGYSYCYEVKYRKKGDSSWNVYHTGVYGNTQNTYILTGLDPETEYEYQIVGIAYPDVANAGTAIATFKTKAFTAPKQLTVSDITPNAATVSWTSFASTVALQYATVPDNVNVGSGWHYYDDGEPQTSIGTGGGRFSWGIMIPAGTYSGSVLNKVSVYDCDEMEGTITIYNVNGTLPSDADVVGSPKDITLTGAKEFVDFDMGNMVIDPTKDLWVILTNESGAGYPAAVSNDVNGDPNGRWVTVSSDDDWMDLADAGVSGYTFMVRAEIGGNVDLSSLTWNTVSGPSSPQTLTNLSNNTQFVVRVQAKEGSTLVSEWVTAYFKTLPDNPVPFDLKAEPEENTATISWNGYSTSYNLRYRTAAQERKTFFDDFENGMDKWTIIRNGEGTEDTDWHAIDLPELVFYYSAHSGDHVAVTRSWTSTNIYTVENWLITPKVTLDGTLRFWVMDDGTYHEHYDVYVSTTTNDISAFTLLASPGNASDLWKEVTVDLSSFHGQKGYIALRHQDTDQDILMIDDFGIYGIGVPASSWTTSKNLSGKSILLGGLDPQTTYEYQVQGVKGSATSEWSPIAQFTTLEAENAIATDIQTIDHGQRTIVKGQKDVWYTIDGQKLSGKPTKKGMYIYNGKVVVN